jgi:hypothetical protein
MNSQPTGMKLRVRSVIQQKSPEPEPEQRHHSFSIFTSPSVGPRDRADPDPWHSLFLKLLSEPAITDGACIAIIFPGAQQLTCAVLEITLCTRCIYYLSTWGEGGVDDRMR